MVLNICYNNRLIGKIVNWLVIVKAITVLLKYKRSFSLASLAIYVFAIGVLSAIILNANSVIENAKVTELINEITYYNNANKQFVVNYSSLPGLVTYEDCIKYAEFQDVCRNQDDINLTTSEYVYNRWTDGCNHANGCFITANGTAGQEDVLRMFLLPMRYLQQAKLIDTMSIDLSKNLSEDSDYSHKVWAKSKIGNNVYVNIYNYNNQENELSRAFLFSGQKILGHTINSGTEYDSQYQLEKRHNQYLLYIKKTEIPVGALPASIAHKADIKIDDGKPLTGRFITFASSIFNSDFDNSEYAKCITKQPVNKDSLINAEYNISKTNGYCNIAYQLDNVIQYINYDNAINYGKPLQSSYSGLKKCTNYQNVSMCESAISKSGLTNQQVSGSKNAKNFAFYTLTYPDGSTRNINISRRFTNNNGYITMYIKNTTTGREITATGACWYYTSLKRTSCYGPTTVNGVANRYICCSANNIDQLLEM